MLGDDYKCLAMRTDDGKSTDRLLIKVQQSQDVNVGSVLNGCLGLSGETGELVDMVKKWIFHGDSLDITHAKKELGDVMWYVAMICHSFGWSLDEIMQINVDKLKARYPEGFTVEASLYRKDDDV